MSSKVFDAERAQLNGKIDLFLELMAREKTEVRAMIGAVIIEIADRRKQQVFGIEAGKADPDTILGTAANLHRQCCRLLCTVCGRDASNPNDMMDAHKMIMGYMHQRSDDITGKVTSPIILQ